MNQLNNVIVMDTMPDKTTRLTIIVTAMVVTTAMIRTAQMIKNTLMNSVMGIH